MKRLVFLVLAMVTPVFAQDPAAAARSAAGCGPNEIQFDVKADASQHQAATPEAGKALVYIFENYPSWPLMRVGMDGQWMGATKGASYVFFSATPGNHHFCTEWQSRTPESLGAAKSLSLEAGKVYFLSMEYAPSGYPAGRVKLELVDEAEGQFLIAGNGISTSKPKK